MKSKPKGRNNKKKLIALHNKEKKELIFKDNCQEYGQVIKMLGNGRCDTYCFDGIRRLCHIRGKMRKKVWINTGDIVLVALRDFQNNKGDIIHKYSPDESRKLRAFGELPLTFLSDDKTILEKKIFSEFMDQKFEFESNSAEIE
ncbi:eukaryotic translation initiation factor 1A [Guillardia theta]|uniref:Eukaryotic translation initiation factor 4C n=1 Tax=Guillardia theta TaxID=55529 RepID=Q9AW58_GUITH|nr:eukaryotic translation initiation factor 1A [Guillardia theta]CAC27012.1 eukaryotic translation initiation factor 1A [Guillardia theta]|mmetsp:Transcript_17287/g.57198  ORF Transcript_17287/g.57198 Transcript_17287/m.57198 type:complete len:144 (-) Transcript_17287:5544-5975(-)